jgi:hypothetical protein
MDSDVKESIVELLSTPAGEQLPAGFGAEVAKVLMEKTLISFLPDAPFCKHAVVYHEQIGLGIITRDDLVNQGNVQCSFLWYYPEVEVNKTSIRVVGVDLKDWHKHLRVHLGLDKDGQA